MKKVKVYLACGHDLVFTPTQNRIFNLYNDNWCEKCKEMVKESSRKKVSKVGTT